MNVRGYLPSAQFALILSSIAISGGLVLAAELYTSPKTPTPTLNPSILTANTQNNDWLETLREIQAQNSAYAAPTPPSEAGVQALLGAAQSPNITSTVGRSLLINLSDARAQGLGEDTPTQDKLIAGAAAQIEQNRGATTYTAAELTVVQNSSENLHTYGNRFMELMSLYPKASYYETLLAIGYATDYKDKTKLAGLPAATQAYKDLARDLSAIAVPQTLVPLHLQIVNNFARMAELLPGMQVMLEDPLRGLGSLQLYESLMQETARVFTNMAQQLSKDDILFTTEEPGRTWNSLLP